MLPFLWLTFPISTAQSTSCEPGWVKTPNFTCINVLEFFPPNPSVSFPFCEPGWIYSSHSNKCYRIFPITLSSFSSAREFCSIFNSTLATLDSQSDIYEISTRGWYPDFKNEPGDFAWMGLSKQTRFHWRWETGIPLGAEIWTKGSSEKITTIWERMCAVYDPTSVAENEIRGAMKPIECEDSGVEVGNVICEQNSISLNITNTPDDCDIGWYSFNDTGLCYKVLQGQFSFDERKNECGRHKAELVALKSAQEMEFLANLLTSGWRLPQTPATKNLVWIGSVVEKILSSTETSENNTSWCYTLDPESFTYLNGTNYLGVISIDSCDSDYIHFICSKSRSIERDEPNYIQTKLHLMLAIVSAVLLLVIITVCVAFLVCRKQLNRTRGRPAFATAFSRRFTHSTCSVEGYPLLEIGNSFKLDDIKITETIGSGHFGCVYAAELHQNNTNVKIAVKRCRIGGDPEQLRCISSELAAMSKLPMHPNVVALIGSVISELKTSGQLYTVMELCEMKSLLSFVSKYQNSDYVNELEANSELNSHYYNINEQDHDYMNTDRSQFTKNKLRTTDLLMFSVQIANGICHLADNHCIHRDLAARNILLNCNLICKISDFGLARIVEPNYYNTESTTEATHMAAAPQRWMAPESLENNVFSHASDVWSFAIVLFELFSLGKQPYYKFTQDKIRNAIMSGEINDQPEYCHDQIYDLMKKCWNREATSRPTSKECYDVLKQHLKMSYPMGSQNLDDMLKTETVRQRETKELCTPRTYYNT